MTPNGKEPGMALAHPGFLAVTDWSVADWVSRR